MKFYIYENVPQWLSYRKEVEAESVEAALAMIEEQGFGGIIGEETGPLFGEVVEGAAVTYDQSSRLGYRQRR